MRLYHASVFVGRRMGAIGFRFGLECAFGRGGVSCTVSSTIEAVSSSLGLFEGLDISSVPGRLRCSSACVHLLIAGVGTACMGLVVSSDVSSNLSLLAGLDRPSGSECSASSRASAPGDDPCSPYCERSCRLSLAVLPVSTGRSLRGERLLKRPAFDSCLVRWKVKSRRQLRVSSTRAED